MQPCTSGAASAKKKKIKKNIRPVSKGPSQSLSHSVMHPISQKISLSPYQRLYHSSVNQSDSQTGLSPLFSSSAGFSAGSFHVSGDVLSYVLMVGLRKLTAINTLLLQDFTLTPKELCRSFPVDVTWIHNHQPFPSIQHDREVSFALSYTHTHRETHTHTHTL